MKLKPIVAIDIGATKIACVVAQPNLALSANGHGSASLQAERWDIVGTGMAVYPGPHTSWPCEPALLARTLEQALDAAGVWATCERAIVSLSHPAATHQRVTAQLQLADEPVTIRRRHVAQLREQAIGSALGLDHDVLMLAPVGYAGNGFEDVRDPVGLSATRVAGTFNLIAIPSAVRHAVGRAVESLGLTIERLLYGLETCAVTTQRQLLIDMGGLCTDLGLLDRGSWVRSLTIPWGGALLVEQIAASAGCTREAAVAAAARGLASPEPATRTVIQRQLELLADALRQFLGQEPRPDVTMVTGRAALMDGCLEWIEAQTGIKTVLARHPRASRETDMGRQIGLSLAYGALDTCQELSARQAVRSPRFIDRLLERTQALLVEYF